MCGFAGIVSWDGRYRIERPVLEEMSAKIAHRGPDGEGIWLNHESEISGEKPQVGLVHRRLAIIDLDPRANQPFTDGQGRWLVFNGEIYNYRELRAELSTLDPNYQWKSASDTEVLLRAYAVWSDECVERLNGMFAFVIWDENRNRLCVARDPMGQKPLFLAYDPGPVGIRSISFASELGPLTAGRALNSRALQSYLAYGYTHTQTLYESVYEIKSGKRESIGRGSIRQDRYFTPTQFLPKHIDDTQAIAETRRLVRQSVQRQLVADVPIGCFLSGGVDSSVIAACMRDHGPVQTFSIGFDDPRYDETGYAARVAKHLGTDHHEFRVTPDAVSDLPKLSSVFGQPFADSSALPTHYLSRATRKHVKVALSGDGGDELFGGYDRYRAMQLTGKLDLLPKAMRWLAGRTITAILPSAHPKSRLAHLRRLSRTLDSVVGERYDSYMRLFDNELIEELQGEPVQPSLERIPWYFDQFLEGRSAVECALAVDRIFYLPDDLLTKVDRCSMLHALEVRSPFMDHELVQFAATLTTPQLLKGGPKRMLREAFADILPAWVFKRKKMGFAVPIGEWFRGPLRAMLRDSLFASNSFASSHFKMPVVQRLIEEHETEKVDHSQRLYALLMLELWWQQQ